MHNSYYKVQHIYIKLPCEKCMHKMFVMCFDISGVSKHNQNVNNSLILFTFLWPLTQCSFEQWNDWVNEICSQIRCPCPSFVT